MNKLKYKRIIVIILFLVANYGSAQNSDNTNLHSIGINVGISNGNLNDINYSPLNYSHSGILYGLEYQKVTTNLKHKFDVEADYYSSSIETDISENFDADLTIENLKATYQRKIKNGMLNIHTDGELQANINYNDRDAYSYLAAYSANLKSSNVYNLNSTKAQSNSNSLIVKNRKDKLEFKEFILPGSLMLVGTLLSGSSIEKKIKKSFHDGSEDAIYFSLPIDNLIQYVPIIELYTADILGVKAKNHWFDQTKYLIIANIITGGLTRVGKVIINKERPDGSSHSFPSGHTSFSFTNASVLYHEFKDTAPGLAYSGYVLTSLVGGLRIVNNKHWLSDVMVGAGLGILVTKLVYHFEPLKNWNPFKKTDKILLLPNINNQHVGLYFKMEF